MYIYKNGHKQLEWKNLNKPFDGEFISEKTSKISDNIDCSWIVISWCGSLRKVKVRRGN